MGCEFCPYAIFEESDRNAVWCEKTNSVPYLTGGCEDCYLERNQIAELHREKRE